MCRPLVRQSSNCSFFCRHTSSRAVGIGALVGCLASPYTLHGAVSTHQTAAEARAIANRRTAQAVRTSTPNTKRSTFTPAVMNPATDLGPIRVTVDPSIDSAALLPSWIRERNPTVAANLTRNHRHSWISVAISGSTYEYRVTVIAMRNGDPIEPAMEPVTCECNSGALLSTIDEEIARAATQLNTIHVETPHPPTALRPLPTPQPERRAPLDKLSTAGMITSSTGVALLGAGAAFAVVGEQETRDYPGFIDRDYLPLGYVALSMGIAAVASGVTMFAIHRVHLRHSQRTRATPARKRQSTRKAMASIRPLALVVGAPRRTAAFWRP